MLTTGGGYGGDGGYGGGRGGKYCINNLSQFDVFSYVNNSFTSDFNKVVVEATAVVVVMEVDVEVVAADMVSWDHYDVSL